MDFRPLTLRQPTHCSVCGNSGAAIGTFGADERLCRKCLFRKAARFAREASMIIEWLEENPPGLEWKERTAAQ